MPEYQSETEEVIIHELTENLSPVKNAVFAENSDFKYKDTSSVFVTVKLEKSDFEDIEYLEKHKRVLSYKYIFIDKEKYLQFPYIVGYICPLIAVVDYTRPLNSFFRLKEDVFNELSKLFINNYLLLPFFVNSKGGLSIHNIQIEKCSSGYRGSAFCKLSIEAMRLVNLFLFGEMYKVGNIDVSRLLARQKSTGKIINKLFYKPEFDLYNLHKILEED